MILIIGAGISGLSAAWHLQEAGIGYEILEASDKPGGYIQSIKKDECLLELGPNSILADNELLEFIHKVGAESELVKSNPVSKSRFILKDGSYRKLPDKPPSLLFDSFFSFSTKWKIATEPFSKPANIENESLDSFFRRKLGNEVADYALNPFITGIYAGDPKQLLVEETFPVLKEYERNYGSIIKGFIKNKPARKESYSFKNGMATLPHKIAGNLTSLTYGFKVHEISVSEQGVVVKGTNSKGEAETKQGSSLIITTPTESASGFLKNSFPEFSMALNKVYYPPMCIVHSVYLRSQLRKELNGFGALNPKIENQFSSGCIWSSSVFPDRSPADKYLFTSFVGGTLNAAKTDLPESEITTNVHQELSRLFEIQGKPQFQHFVKWEKAIPQYTQELKGVKAFLPELEKNHIYFSVNWINGVSLSDCIKKGKTLAEKIIHLHSR